QRVGEHPTAQLTRLELVGKMMDREVSAADFTSGAAPVPREVVSPVMEARQLGRRGAIAPVDLSLRPGEVVGLGGLLGSGRTETARLLFGIDAADSGEIDFKG